MAGVGSGGDGREFGGLRKRSSRGSWRQQGNLVSICFMRLLSYFNHFYSFIVYFIRSSFLIRMMRWRSTRHGRKRDNEVGDYRADEEEAGDNGADDEEAGDGGVDEEDEETVMRTACDNGNGGGMQRWGGGGGGGRWWR